MSLQQSLHIDNFASSNKADFAELKNKSRKLKNKYIPLFLELFFDVIAIVVSFFVQYYIRFETGIIGTNINPTLHNDFTVVLFPLMFVLAYWTLIYAFSGLYINWFERSPFDEFFTLIKVNLFGSFVFAFLLFADSSGSTRMLFLLHFIVLSLSVIIFRFIARKIQQKLRENGIIKFNVVVIGDEQIANALDIEFKKSPSWGFHSIGYVEYENANIANASHQNKLGDFSNLKKVISDYEPDSVVIGCKKTEASKLMEIANICAEKDVRCKIEPDLFHIFTGQSKAITMYGIPFIEISPQLLKYWEELAKRIFDIIFSTLVLIIGSPIWLLTALAIAIESRGGVFYSQERVGKDGKIFRIHKFRSMVSNADKIGNWTAVNDKRVTKFGKFLRKSHLDEIPQFWNVLKGDMSIVGPRPEQEKFVKEFSEALPYYSRRLKVRPGITGWWQVKYTTYDMSIEEIDNRLKDDFYYIENMSLRFDIEIVIRTVWCVIKGHGQA